jgi:hypothetical protein
MPEEEHRIREAALVETVAGSFPANDPPSSLPNMQDLLDALPESRLLETAPLSARFRSEGVTTFRAACDWVRCMPYGRNARQGPDSVFEEKRGTCQSKHGLIALLARELGLPVSQYAGAYRLDESIIEGVDALLVGHHLAYVPQLHCVLKYGDRFFDLTAGNCHGKKKDIVEMDVYFRISPFAQDLEHAVYALAVQYYRHADADFPRHSIDELRSIARACSDMAVATCV